MSTDSDTDSTIDNAKPSRADRKRSILEQAKTRFQPQGVPDRILADDYILVREFADYDGANRRRRLIEKDTVSDHGMFEHQNIDFMEDFAIFRHKVSGTVIWVTPLRCKSKHGSRRGVYFIFPAGMMLKDSKLVQYAAAWKKAGDPTAEIAPDMIISDAIREYLNHKPYPRGRWPNLALAAALDPSNNCEPGPITPSPVRQVAYKPDPIPVLIRRAPPSTLAVARPFALRPAPIVDNDAAAAPGADDAAPVMLTPAQLCKVAPQLAYSFAKPTTPIPQPAGREPVGPQFSPASFAAQLAAGLIIGDNDLREMLVDTCGDRALVDSSFFGTNHASVRECIESIKLQTSNEKASSLLFSWPLMFAVRAAECATRIATSAAAADRAELQERIGAVKKARQAEMDELAGQAEARRRMVVELRGQLDEERASSARLRRQVEDELDALRRQVEQERKAAAQMQADFDAIDKQFCAIRTRSQIVIRPAASSLATKRNVGILTTLLDNHNHKRSHEDSDADAPTRFFE